MVDKVGSKSGVVGRQAPDEDMMTLKFPAVQNPALWLAAGAIVALGLSAPASAQQPGRSNGPNVVYQQGPHTRIYVSKRSWLDGGTEVLPGDRKFTDYAFPSPFGYPTFARENLNRPIDRQPLSTPSDVGGEPTRFPLY